MKKMSLSEMVTYSTVMIQCKHPNGSVSSGTGFIINLCQNASEKTCLPVIITNAHVVKDSTSTVFEFCKADEKGDPVDTEGFSFTYAGNPWQHHPDKDVDLCCLLLGQALNELSKSDQRVFYIPLETSLIPSKKQLEDLFAIEEIVMVGYPIGLSDRYNHKPIVRRGITASHPKNNYQGKREILIDMACFPGSSGSPVFVLNEGLVKTFEGVSVGNRIFLLGVLYGGPQYTASGALTMATIPNVPRPIVDIPTNLGMIIKSERILEFEQFFRKQEAAQNGSHEV